MENSDILFEWNIFDQEKTRKNDWKEWRIPGIEELGECCKIEWNNNCVQRWEHEIRAFEDIGFKIWISLITEQPVGGAVL